MEAGGQEDHIKPEEDWGAPIVRPGSSDPAGREEQQLQAASLLEAAAALDVEALPNAGVLREQSAGGSAAAGSDLPPNKRQRSDAFASGLQPDQPASMLFTAFPAGAGATVDPGLVAVGTPLSGTVDAISDSSTYFVTLTLAGVDFKGEVTWD